jgi:serpin B
MINRNGAGGLKQLGAIWGQTRYKFAPLFLETLARYYGPEITGVDFYYAAQAAFDDSIKPWIKDNVGIQYLLYSSDISNRTRLTTASATVLDATWQFDTIQGRFEPLDKKPVLVSMLTRTDLFNYRQEDGYRAFELPFQNSDLALLVIMPDSGRFKEVQAALTSERLQAITAGLAPTQTTVYLPLFNIDAARSSLTSMLTALNRSGAFSEGQADFSGVNNAGYLFLQALNHKTVLSLKETGVKEAAATAVVHQATKDEPPGVWSGVVIDTGQNIFPCNAVPYYDPALVLARPFLFALRDRQTGSILAMGQLIDPGGGTPVAPDQLINTCP